MARNSRRPPIINAPPWVTALALVLLAAHGGRVLLSAGLEDALLWNVALIPERFWGWPSPIQMPSRPSRRSSRWRSCMATGSMSA